MTIRGAIRSSDPDVALDAAAEARKSTPRRAWRVPLAAKLAAALVGLVGLVLLVNGAVNTWLNYNQAKDAALEVQQEKARSAAVRVGEFLADIETQLGWTTGAEWRFAKPDQQRYDFIRLLRQVPAITELSYLDGQGKEQLKVSRLEPDSVGSGKDFSTDPRFTQAVADKIWFGPVEFRRGSEPYMTIALAHVGKNSGVTVADVNLKLIWDVISAIRVGDKGYAFVVDGKGRLIAHPDLSLVLRDTDFSQLPQVRQALDANARAEPGAAATPGPSVGAAEIATAFDGGKVLTAYAVAPQHALDRLRAAAALRGAGFRLHVAAPDPGPARPWPAAGAHRRRTAGAADGRCRSAACNRAPKNSAPAISRSASTFTPATRSRRSPTASTRWRAESRRATKPSKPRSRRARATSTKRCNSRPRPPRC